MYIKNMIKHFNLITKHKWIVFKLSVRAGIPIRGFLHDFSKYLPEEFFEGIKYYIGTHSPITECKKKEGYSKAWLHHKGRNKHHTEYWYDEFAPDKTPIMPYKYFTEMICDKLAAGIVYKGKEWKQEYQLSYWNKEKRKSEKYIKNIVNKKRTIDKNVNYLYNFIVLKKLKIKMDIYTYL